MPLKTQAQSYYAKRSYSAKRLKAIKRKQLAIDSLSHFIPISSLATDNNVSRKFVCTQKQKALMRILKNPRLMRSAFYFICR